MEAGCGEREREYELEWVKGRAEHVKVVREARGCLEHIAPEVVLPDLVARAVEVDVDLGLGVQVAVPDPLGGRDEQLPRVGPVDAAAADGPQQAVEDLVAQVDDGRRDALGLQRVADVEGVVVDLLEQAVDVRRPPGGDPLLARVCPRVAEVQVDVDVEAGGLCALGQRDVVVEVIVALCYPLQTFVSKREGISHVGQRFHR